MSAEYDYLFKILLVGDAAVGKSTFLERFHTDVYVESIYRTIGVDFKIRTLDIAGRIVKVQMWDTSGSEQFRTIYSSYYRGVHGVMIFYDTTYQASFHNVARWMKEVDMYAAKGINIFLVGTKCDDAARREISYCEAAKLAVSFDVPFLEISAKYGQNVEAAVRLICAQIIQRITPTRAGSITSHAGILSRTSCSLCGGSGRRGLLGPRGFGLIQLPCPSCREVSAICNTCGGSGRCGLFGPRGFGLVQTPCSCQRVHTQVLPIVMCAIAGEDATPQVDASAYSEEEDCQFQLYTSLLIALRSGDLPRIALACEQARREGLNVTSGAGPDIAVVAAREAAKQAFQSTGRQLQANALLEGNVMTLDVAIVTFGGDQWEFKACPAWTVQDVKAVTQCITEIPGPEQHLFVGDVELRDHELMCVATSEGTVSLGLIRYYPPDRPYWLDLVRNDGNALGGAPQEIRADDEIVLEAVRQSGYALEHADTRLRADHKVVSAAVAQNESAWIYAAPELQALWRPAQ